MVTRPRHPSTTRPKSAALLLAAVAALLLAAPPSFAQGADDCESDNNDRRISGCSALIATPGLDSLAKSLAYARRALAFSLKGDYSNALPDYGEALKLDPGSAMVLNNRAWVYWRLGRIDDGLADAERSLEINAQSHHVWDTRAHLRQARGEASRAIRDYEQAMRIGGEAVVRLYQCGLEAQGHYKGPHDGLMTYDLKSALIACVNQAGCDPLPPDEECKSPTS